MALPEHETNVDSAWNSPHHTLGLKHDQASPGDHNHNGVNSNTIDPKRLMAGITITGSRGGNVALANLLTELSKAFGFTNGTSA